MAALTASSLLRIWELGDGLHVVDQALLVLSAAFPDETADELASLTVGQRDARLLSIYEHSFGPHVSGLTDCPQCRETLECTFRVADIGLPAPSQAANHVYQLDTAGYTVQFQLPCSRHLAAVANLRQEPQPVVGETVAGARTHLLEQCVVEVGRTGERLTVADLPDDVSAAVVEEMADADPQADVRFQFACAACAHQWAVPFDIVPFLWAKIAERARTLLHEIHLLATAYHWREADILALSSVRRRSYLDLVTP